MPSSLLLNTNEDGAEQLAPTDIVFQAGSVVVRSGGTAGGVVARKCAVPELYGDKVTAHFQALMPMIEQQTDIAFSAQGIIL